MPEERRWSLGLERVFPGEGSWQGRGEGGASVVMHRSMNDERSLGRVFLSLPEQQGPGGRRGWGGRSPSCKEQREVRG